MKSSSSQSVKQEGHERTLTDNPKLLQSVAQSTSYNIVLQLLFRVLTFVLNAIVLRYVTKDLLGVVNVRLTLLYSTTLFIGREAFRKACLSKTEKDPMWQEIVNLTWCCPILGSIAALLLSSIWMYVLELPDPDTVPYYGYGVVCFGLSATLEMLSEPLFIVSQKLLYVRLKAIIEGLALLAKCLTTIILIMLFPKLGVIAFCIAQLTFTTVYLGGYFLYFAYIITSKSYKEFPLTSVRQMFPDFTSEKVIINRELAMLTWSFLKQSFLKQLLTEGERYMMTLFNILSFADQGIFDVISNLGSLIARFFFLPLEESSYLLFSQSITRGIPAMKQSQEDWRLATTVFNHLLKLVILVGLVVLTFGFPYSQLALHIYGGLLLSSGTGPYLLRWYCVYVQTLAINGITEGFSFATMSKDAIDRYNYKMLGFSAAFLVASYILTNAFGSAGFIMANSLNMIARIVHSVYTIERFYVDTNASPLRKSLPSFLLFLLFVASCVVTSLSQIYFGLNSPVIHILVGVACLLAISAATMLIESEMMDFLYQKFVRPMIRKKAD